MGETQQSASQLAMDEFLNHAEGFKEPRIAVDDPNLPTLPGLKAMAQSRKTRGFQTLDQSAGDIAEVGAPLNYDFRKWKDEVRDSIKDDKGNKVFPHVEGEVFGYEANYRQQYPVVLEELAKSWGLKETPFKGIQTVSGRNAIDCALRGLKSRKKNYYEDRDAIIMDPMAWSGYGPLAEGLDVKIIHAPAVKGHGLSLSADGLSEAIEFASKKGFRIIGAVPIVPSNPTGESMSHEDLRNIILDGAKNDVPIMADAFYSPLHKEGHRAAVDLGDLEDNLPPEVLAYFGILVGETKVLSSQQKTGSMLWLAPEGHDKIATHMYKTGMKRLLDTNTYPRPNEALAAYALHTFTGGIHAAMGPRYEKLDEARVEMRRAMDELGLPFTIGDSFYGVAALTDPKTGEGLLKDQLGRPLTRPNDVANRLAEEYGLVGAPGAMFSPAPEAGQMVRLTAAVTVENVRKLQEVIGRMISDASK
ncbi:aminotransferase class I/II-fold pyridoxal phosphate-dependent enzyme [Candidatus Peregrinibacteria bacterium]|nr:aminotransferase class I/II-fold pyridoxal phosphate-dependent enzyme [Candidatus Peregrinibacteria bacterium]